MSDSIFSRSTRPRRGLRPSYALAISVVLAASFEPAGAMAHPAIDEAVAHYQRGELEQAEAAFARAETEADLTRDDLVELYSRRALLHFALRQDEELETDLLRLATLDPYHPLDDTAPPTLRQRFDRIRAQVDDPVAVGVEVRRREGAVHVQARVDRDPARLVRRIAIKARSKDGPWSTGEDRVRLQVDPGAPVTYRAQAIGPGGAIVATASDTAGHPAPPPVDMAPEANRRHDESTGASPWPWIGAGAGVAAVAAIVTAVVVARSDGAHTQLDAPSVPGF